MRSLRRLFVVSIASLSAIILCSTGLRAQTTATPPTASVPAQNAWPFVAQIPPSPWTSQSGPPLPAPSTTVQLPPLDANTVHRLLGTLDAQKLALLAQNNGPCYALRTYGFTAGRDPAEAPRLSSHSTCTPASKLHLRELVKAPSNSSH